MEAWICHTILSHMISFIGHKIIITSANLLVKYYIISKNPISRVYQNDMLKTFQNIAESADPITGQWKVLPHWFAEFYRYWRHEITGI